MIEIKIGQVWRVTGAVANPKEHPLFIQKSSYTPDGEKLAYHRLQPDDKIIVKDIDDTSTWVQIPGSATIFMVNVIYNGAEYRVANEFIYKYFILDEPDT